MLVHSVAWSWWPGQQDFKVGRYPPFLPGMPQSGVTSFLPQLPGSMVLFSLYLFPPPAPQKKRKDLSASPYRGEDTVREGGRWAGLNLWLPAYSLCKHSPHPVPRHPLASKGSPSGPRTLGRKAAQP